MIHQWNGVSMNRLTLLKLKFSLAIIGNVAWGQKWFPVIFTKLLHIKDGRIVEDRDLSE